MLRSVRPTICLSRFLILSRSLDGDERASSFQTQSIGVSTVDYARVQILSAGERHIASPRDTLVYLVCVFLFYLHVCSAQLVQ